MRIRSQMFLGPRTAHEDIDGGRRTRLDDMTLD